MRRISELLKTLTSNGTGFICPVCQYSGRFRTLTPETGVRKNACCPTCGSLERHRLQYLVLNALKKQRDFSRLRMLHFAPEDFMAPHFRSLVKEYRTADLFMSGVDYKVDITALPFANGEFDFIFASHVLEHIPDDLAALSEVRRVLSASGVAILPVPVVSPETIEYPEPNPFESGHVRAPGFDYFDRYRTFFTTVSLYTSDDFPEMYQTYIYEDRTQLPAAAFPLRKPVPGVRHVDVVPVCFA